MSHRQHSVHYDYLPPPDNYFVEDPEGYPTDYSDNEFVQENVGDVYGRNATVVPVQVIPCSRKVPHLMPKRRSDQFLHQPYYGRSIVPPQRSYYSKGYDPTREYYPISTASQHDAHFGTKAYSSAYHNIEQFIPVTHRKNIPEMDYSRINHKVVGVKKFPVTFQTPKYYKKTPTNTVYKRPSTLCLPGAVQQDPAVIRRPKKVPVFADSGYEGSPETEEVLLDCSGKPAYKPAPDFKDSPHRVDSQGDVNVKTPNFDEVLDQLEKGIENKCDMAKFTKLLKPRVPASVRAKQEKTKNNKPVSDILNYGKDKNNTNEVQQQIKDMEDSQCASPNSLEKLLNQLKKCEYAIGKDEFSRNSNANQEKQEQDNGEGRKNRGRGDVVNENPNINNEGFKYHDMNEPVRNKSNSGLSEKIMDDLTKQLLINSSSKTKNFSKQALDDHCALELHRSKSYIVNLIDRALSKELGTVPSNRYYKELDNMSPKRAIELMNRHGTKSDKDLLQSSMTESQLTNFSEGETVDGAEEPNRPSKVKLCHCQSEEPIYLKQLKQLRWGHLRHIQSEVKKLEELERFLDSCSISTIPETV